MISTRDKHIPSFLTQQGWRQTRAQEIKRVVPGFEIVCGTNP